MEGQFAPWGDTNYTRETDTGGKTVGERPLRIPGETVEEGVVGRSQQYMGHMSRCGQTTIMGHSANYTSQTNTSTGFVAIQV